MTKEEIGRVKRNALMDRFESGRYLSNENEKAAYDYFYNRKPYQYTIAEPATDPHKTHRL